MSTQFQCDVCRYSRPVPEEYAGRKVRCAQCAAVTLVRNGEAKAEAAAPPKQCPFCLEPVQAEARKCRWCGEIIDRDLAIAKEREKIREIERHQRILQVWLPGARPSLVCGAISILLCMLPGMSLFLGAVSIMLGIQAIKQHKAEPHLEGLNYARVGLVLGILGILAYLVLVITLKGHSFLTQAD
jgi:hypothetical protein